ncbi:hypothetical protein V6M85_07410 [Sulfolobus tengchongensis]|uniref:Uncharacterized protein n=1 Tax=Sulfolobus tengchongensis TaxID=207809 RepID=A0AAX4KX43_9CREN
MVRREDIMIFVMSSFVVYFVSFLILLSIFLSETYHFIVEGNKIIIKRTISDKFKYEFTLSDKNIILGISNGSIVGNLIIIYSDKLLFKFLTTTKNVKIIQTKILNMGYRNGGMYKVCKTCGSINELDVNACDICGSRNLATYNLLWLD